MVAPRFGGDSLPSEFFHLKTAVCFYNQAVFLSSSSVWSQFPRFESVRLGKEPIPSLPPTVLREIYSLSG